MAVFKPGDKVIAIIDGFPINLRNNVDREMCKVIKGDTFIVKSIVSDRHNTSIIEIELDKAKELFRPRYWASYFQAVETAKDVPVLYTF